MDFFFDNQIRRVLLQFMRIFSDLRIESDPDENGNRIQRRIPIKYGDMSRLVGHILNQNSQNTMLSSPSMAVTIKALDMNAERRQDPTFIGYMSGVERKYDKDNNVYLPEQGNRFTVERYMPVPYDLTLNLDIWTTNTNTKMQIIEQILTIFNPAVQLETVDNPYDWSAITEVELTDITWSNRSIPVGADSNNDFATLTFKMPIWINPPAKLKRNALIEKIVTRVTDVGNLSDIEISRAVFDVTDFGKELSQFCITPGNYKVRVGSSDNVTYVTLLNGFGLEDQALTWDSITTKYGVIEDGVTRIVLKTHNDIGSDVGDVYGYVQKDINKNNQLIFSIVEDSLPQTIDVSPITAVIDPTIAYPGHGLPAAANGQKYIISSAYSDNTEISINNSPGWGTLVAHENDIIKYDGVKWIVVFDAASSESNKYVKNLSDGQHYKFDGSSWIYTYLGEYNAGYWKIENLNSQQ